MKNLRILPLLLIGAVGLAACADEGATPLGPTPRLGPTGVEAAKSSAIGVNVGLNTAATDAIRAELSAFGTIWGEIPEINAVMLAATVGDIAAIEALPYVAWAEQDSEVDDGQPDAVLAEDFTDGLSTWNLDAINVTTSFPFGARQVAETGAGVYVGVLDTGLLRTWRLYFPEERIAEEYARAFRGGPLAVSAQPEVPNMWERDVESHGTHVTSTIIGYSLNGTPITGVAPEATIIPVKVLNQNGSGWSSVTAQGIVYIGTLKAGPLSDSPVVINMSLGGPSPSLIQEAAIDFAIAQGVVVVASAGNRGDAGMGYPGAFPQVISAGSAGWGDCDFPPASLADCFGQWKSGSWWLVGDVDEGDTGDFYISGFSSREKPGQDLDVIAPGHWVVGPWQLDMRGDESYFFVSGTSMASPHVAGIVALMLEKNPGLTASQVETILEGAASAIPAPDTHRPLAPGPACCFTISWGADATGHGLITADAALGGTP